MKRNLLTEGGALNNNGEYLVGYFKQALRDLLEEARDAEFSAEELALLGSILQAKVGTAVTAEVSKLKVEKNRRENHPFWKMSDEEFLEIFHAKYNGVCLLAKPIEDEDEYARYGEIMARKLKKLLAEQQQQNLQFVYPQGKDRF